MRSLTHTQDTSFTPVRTGVLQRRSTSQAEVSEVPQIVQEVLRSPGQSLDFKTQSVMESEFGYDFSRVQVHTDSKAVDSARAVHASAYTIGNHIVFGSNQYNAGTPEGQGLIAHELMHVVQQAL